MMKFVPWKTTSSLKLHRACVYRMQDQAANWAIENKDGATEINGDRNMKIINNNNFFNFFSFLIILKL